MMEKSRIIIPKDYIEIKDISNIQDLLLRLLKDFHKICEKHKIFYNVFGGTMLGAVRHSGIIPWDDDIDITMPRPDYEKFIKLVNREYNDKFCVKTYWDKNYCYPFAKFMLNDSILIENINEKYGMLKAYIDIFPVDGYPAKNELRFFKKLQRLKRKTVWAVSAHKKKSGLMGFIKYFAKCSISSFYGLNGVMHYNKKYDEIVKRYDYNSSNIVLCNGAGWYQKGKLQKAIYENRKLYDFNGIKVWGIADYDEHLTNLYGDYMLLPPIDKRYSNHDYHLFVKKDYLQEN